MMHSLNDTDDAIKKKKKDPYDRFCGPGSLIGLLKKKTHKKTSSPELGNKKHSVIIPIIIIMKSI